MRARRLAAVTGTALLAAATGCDKLSTREREVTSHDARRRLELLHDAAMGYAATTAGANPASARFPGPSITMTPAVGTCCARGGLCDPQPSLWQGDPWRSLGFAVDRRQPYAYDYVVADDGKAFTARAIGDLDCDGVLATFTVSGTLDATGAKRPGPIVIEYTNPLE